MSRWLLMIMMGCLLMPAAAMAQRQSKKMALEQALMKEEPPKPANAIPMEYRTITMVQGLWSGNKISSMFYTDMNGDRMAKPLHGRIFEHYDNIYLDDIEVEKVLSHFSEHGFTLSHVSSTLSSSEALDALRVITKYIITRPKQPSSKGTVQPQKVE